MNNKDLCSIDPRKTIYLSTVTSHLNTDKQTTANLSHYLAGHMISKEDKTDHQDSRFFFH